MTFWKKENMQTCSYQRWIKPPFKRFKFQKRWKDVVCILLLLFINIKIFKVFVFFSGGGCSDFLKADDIKAFKCYCLHFVLFFLWLMQWVFFSYKRTKSKQQKGVTSITQIVGVFLLIVRTFFVSHNIFYFRSAPVLKMDNFGSVQVSFHVISGNGSKGSTAPWGAETVNNRSVGLW